MSKGDSSEVAKINDLIAKCVAPSSKLDQSKLCGNIGSGISKTAPQQTEMPTPAALFDAPHQIQVQRPAAKCDDYCPAPSFDLRLDKIFRTSINEEVLELQLSQLINGASSGTIDMCPQARGKTPVIIEIADEDDQ